MKNQTPISTKKFPFFRSGDESPRPLATYSFWARAYYEQQIAKGKSRQAAVRALAYKWIRVIWKCWQTHIPYNEVRYLENLRKKGVTLVVLCAEKRCLTQKSLDLSASNGLLDIASGTLLCRPLFTTT